MREIKFRAWDIERLRWLEFDLREVFESRLTHVIPRGKYILMQYTGIKDRNGKEIYEGDIVTDGEIKGIVYWHDYMGYANIVGHLAWVVGDPRKPSDYVLLGSNGGHYSEGLWEILGNTYENPELLGEKK